MVFVGFVSGGSRWNPSASILYYIIVMFVGIVSGGSWWTQSVSILYYIIVTFVGFVSGGSQWNQESFTHSPAVIFDLKADTEYSFKVAANNFGGTGNYSEAVKTSTHNASGKFYYRKQHKNCIF